jgi:hypothetical protein
MSMRSRVISATAICLVGAGMLMPPTVSVPFDGGSGADQATASVSVEKGRSELRIATSSKSVQGFGSVALALTATPERPDRAVTL